MQIKCARMDFFGKIRNILCLAEGHTQSLQLGNTCCQDGLGIDGAQCILHPLPDGRLCLGGDLLPDDVVNDG